VLNFQRLGPSVVFSIPKSLILSQLLITWLRKVESALLYGREGKYLNLFDFQTITRTLLKTLQILTKKKNLIGKVIQKKLRTAAKVLRN